MTQICKKGHFPTNDNQTLHSICKEKQQNLVSKKFNTISLPACLVRSVQTILVLVLISQSKLIY